MEITNEKAPEEKKEVVRKEKICVRLKDGREISAPLDWFPTLKAASPKKRRNWHLIGRGIGIYWPDLDEDISVGGLLRQYSETSPT